MLQSIYFLHGFASDDGRSSVDRLQLYFLDPTNPQYHVKDFNYGRQGIVGVWLGNSRWAENLAYLVRNEALPPHIIAHSNGCRVAQLASLSKPSPAIASLVLLAPALSPRAKFGDGVKTVHVFSTPGDVPTLAAEAVARVFPGLGWGSMGALGYRGRDPRVHNYNRLDFTQPSLLHTDLFRNPDYWAQVILALLRGQSISQFRRKERTNVEAVGLH